MTSIHISRPTMLLGSFLVAIGFTACIPVPASVGEGLDEAGDDAETDDAVETEDAPAAGGLQPVWSELHEPGTRVGEMIGMPDGGLVTVNWTFSDHPIAVHMTRYDPDGTIAWTRPVDGKILALLPLPDGRILAGGETNGNLRASISILDGDGTSVANYVHPVPGPDPANSRVADIVVDDDDIFYLVSKAGIEPGVPGDELYRIGYDLAEPELLYDGFEMSPNDLGLLPSGEILTVERMPPDYETERMRTFSPSGELLTVQQLPTDPIAGSRFADDEPLVMLSWIEGAVTLQGIDGTADIDLTLPSDSFGSGPMLTFDGDVAMAVSGDGAESIDWFQYSAAGDLIRSGEFEPFQGDQHSPSDIVIAADGSLYIGGTEADSTMDVPYNVRGFVLKLPPA